MCLVLRRAAVVFLAFLAATAQPSTPRRKKIGIALSGGSSLGLTHIGVLQWFEENRIPIDYIAGTSMGGLVGGIHATGHSSAEMRQFIAEINWNEALAQSPPYRDLSFRRKEDRRDYPTILEFGFKGGIRLPSGLSAGHGVGLILSRFAAPYNDLKSFDDLPTPFRCVATDLVEAKGVVFKDGSLFDALRATMSLPALFSPVQNGKQILVDGGLVNNFPLDLVKGMGADVVIGVALNTAPDPKVYESLLGVAGRSLSVMITENERRNLAIANILIEPELKGFGGSDYPRYEELRQSGYDAAAKQAGELKKLSLGEAEWDEYQKARLAKRRSEQISPEFIRIEGELAGNRSAALIKALQPGKGQIIDQHFLEHEMTKLTGMGRYDKADYRFVTQNGKPGLEVRVHEKTHGPPFLNVGLLIDGGPDQGLRFGIGGRLTFLDVGGPASEWRSDFSIGQVNRLSTEYYYRIKGGKWFLVSRAYYLEDKLPYYQGDYREFEFKQRTLGAGGGFGYAFGRFQEARFGYDIGSIESRVLTGVNPEEFQGRSSAFRARWAYDNQDNAVIPRAGTRVMAEARWFTDYPGVDQQFPSFNASLARAGVIKGRYSWLWEANGGITRNDPKLGAFYYTGGLLRISALERGQFLGSHYYENGLYALRSLGSEQLSLFGKMYIALGWEMGNAWVDKATPRPYNSGVLGLMGDTPLGLVFFGGAIGERGEKKILFRLGRYF